MVQGGTTKNYYGEWMQVVKRPRAWNRGERVQRRDEPITRKTGQNSFDALQDLPEEDAVRKGGSTL